MQTPLTILIETLTKKKNAALAEVKRLGDSEQSTTIQDAMFAAYADAINEATQLLETERQVLIDFTNLRDPRESAINHFNNTFKQ